MLEGKKIVVIMPAYNAEQTLKKTFNDLPEIVDKVIVVDDYSSDKTKDVAKKLKLDYYQHKENKGYGANQKTCYKLAIQAGADIIVMVHPDYQYSPKLVTAMSAMIVSGHYDIILASRILGSNNARQGKMPLWRFVANRFLTYTENFLLGQRLSEYHTGYRAYTKKVLQEIPLDLCSDDFVFDNEILAQAFHKNFRIGEVSCPTKYQNDSSSISFSRSIKYGLEVLKVGLFYRLDKMGFINYKILTKK